MDQQLWWEEYFLLCHYWRRSLATVFIYKGSKMPTRGLVSPGDNISSRLVSLLTKMAKTFRGTTTHAYLCKKWSDADQKYFQLTVQLVLQLKMELIRSQLVLETVVDYLYSAACQNILSADSNCQVFLVCSHIHIKLSLITYPNVTQVQSKCKTLIHL